MAIANTISPVKTLRWKPGCIGLRGKPDKEKIEAVGSPDNSNREGKKNRNQSSGIKFLTVTNNSVCCQQTYIKL